MARSAHVHIAGVWHQLEEILGVLLLHQFGGCTTDQQRRNGDRFGGLDQRLLDLPGARPDAAIAFQETRIPMPAPSTVRPKADVLTQADKISWGWAVRVIFSRVFMTLILCTIRQQLTSTFLISA